MTSAIQAFAAVVILTFAAIGALWVDGRLDRCPQRDGLHFAWTKP